MPKLTVYNIKGQESGSMDLPEDFGKDVNEAVIHQAVVMYQANKRQGNADTKIRSEISGATRSRFARRAQAVPVRDLPAHRSCAMVVSYSGLSRVITAIPSRRKCA